MNMDIVNRLLSSRVRRWKSMKEDAKLHEIRLEICRYFAVCIDGQALEDVYNELQRAQVAGVSTISAMRMIDALMDSKIRYEWGNDVANIVKECID